MIYTAMAILLLCAGIRDVVSSGQDIVNAVVGGNVTLVANYTGTPTEINWEVNGNKYVDMELIPSLTTMFYRNKERSSIEKNGTLTIKDLSKKDNGTYKAEALIDNRFQETDYRLTVYERLSEPSTNGSIITEQIIDVICKSSESDVSSYEWQNSTGDRVSSEQRYRTSRPKEGVTLTCVVRNPASENRTSITIPPIKGPPAVMWKRWGHLLSPMAVCVLYTVLLCCIISDFWTMRDVELHTDAAV